MKSFLFSEPPSIKSVAWPFAVSSKSFPAQILYSTTLSASLKVVQVTTMEPGTPEEGERGGDKEREREWEREREGEREHH